MFRAGSASFAYTLVSLLPVQFSADEIYFQKYTTNFERSNWRDMIMMTDVDLTAKGVSAQGARTKVGRPCSRANMLKTLSQFLKVFYNVRDKEGIPHPEGQEEYAPGAGGKDEK